MDIILNIFSNIIPFIFVLTAIVFIHEFGHFWVAKKSGVKVEIFSIGFGPELFGMTDKYGTRWKFCLIPLGGYVKMFSDKNAASQPHDQIIAKLTEEERKTAFVLKSLKIKSAIVAAGPIANYLFSITIFTFFFFTFGYPHASPIVSDVIKDSPASYAGIIPGDVIEEINGQKIESFDDIRNIMSLSFGEELKVKVNAQEKVIIPQKFIEKDPLGYDIETYKLGIITNNMVFKKQGIFKSIGLAISECYKISIMTLKSMGQIITGKRKSDEIGGPIKIARYSAKSLEAGVANLFWFMALLSVNLGLINLFPIPVLDGGHLMIYLAEATLGKKIACKIQEYGFSIGIILLLFLTMFVTFKDLNSLFK